MKPSLIDIAVIGAGPVGLALALHASRVLRPVTASSRGSPAVFCANQFDPPLLFGPGASVMRPVVRITPLCTDNAEPV